MNKQEYLLTEEELKEAVSTNWFEVCKKQDRKSRRLMLVELMPFMQHDIGDFITGAHSLYCRACKRITELDEELK